MCAMTLAALYGLAAGCPADTPKNLLAPTDPTIETRWRPPPSPIAGLKLYRPVEASADWGGTPAPSAKTHGAAKAPGMRGMDMPGMSMGGRR